LDFSIQFQKQVKEKETRRVNRSLDFVGLSMPICWDVLQGELLMDCEQQNDMIRSVLYNDCCFDKLAPKHFFL
jgi:hypothetical protein